MSAGTRSIQMLYRAVLFTFAPTFIELVFVISLLATQFSPMVAMLVAGTFLVYVTWTLTMTQVREKRSAASMNCWHRGGKCYVGTCVGVLVDCMLLGL